jgi:hypothetical protein
VGPTVNDSLSEVSNALYLHVLPDV